MRPRFPVRLPPACWLLGSGALLGIVVYFGLIHWWLVAPAWRDAREMQALRTRQALNLARLAQRPAWQQRLVDLQQAQSSTHDFLPDGDPSAAAADLMQRVVASVSGHGGSGLCEVTQKMPVPASADASSLFPPISVTVSLHCAAEPLAAVLVDLEYGRPYLFVDDFMMYADAPPPQAGGDAMAEVQLTVTGFLGRPAGGPAGQVAARPPP